MNETDTTDVLSLLLVSGQQKAAAAVKALLDPARIRITGYAQSGSNARRLILERSFDLPLAHLLKTYRNNDFPLSLQKEKCLNY